MEKSLPCYLIDMGESGEIVSEDPDLSAVAWAETPAELDTIPAEVGVQLVPLQERLETDAQEYLDTHPAFLARAKRLGHDVIAHDQRILTGIGLVAALGAVGGVVILWQHEQYKKRSKRS